MVENQIKFIIIAQISSWIKTVRELCYFTFFIAAFYWLSWQKYYSTESCWL